MSDMVAWTGDPESMSLKWGNVSPSNRPGQIITSAPSHLLTHPPLQAEAAAWRQFHQMLTVAQGGRARSLVLGLQATPVQDVCGAALQHRQCKGPGTLTRRPVQCCAATSAGLALPRALNRALQASHSTKQPAPRNRTACPPIMVQPSETGRGRWQPGQQQHLLGQLQGGSKLGLDTISAHYCYLRSERRAES